MLKFELPSAVHLCVGLLTSTEIKYALYGLIQKAASLPAKGHQLQWVVYFSKTKKYFFIFSAPTNRLSPPYPSAFFAGGSPKEFILQMKIPFYLCLIARRFLIVLSLFQN